MNIKQIVINFLQHVDKSNMSKHEAETLEVMLSILLEKVKSKSCQK